MTWLKEVDRWPGGTRDPDRDQGDPDLQGELVQVVLEGGSPWGFTLKGGREHRERLIITKVEAGPGAGGLQVGDEVVQVGGVPLGGWRQEAIAMVKSAQRTLVLGVRRRDEAASRTPSWQTSRLSQDPPDPKVPPPPVWQPLHETRPREVPGPGGPTSQRCPSMERPDRPRDPYQSGPLPPNALDPPPGGPPSRAPDPGWPPSRDSGFSCFSGSSSPPEPDHAFLPPRRGPCSEDMFFKGPPSEGAPGPAERPPWYLQPALGTRGWERPRAEDRGPVPGGRGGAGPLWQVPERSRPRGPPPPLAPPQRNDSFAATRVFPYVDRPLAHRRGPGGRPEEGPPGAKDLLRPDVAPGPRPGRLPPPGRLFSSSSTDVRQGGPSYAALLARHHRGHSDETPLPPRGPGPPRTSLPQSVGSYYRSLQDIPADARRLPGAPAALSALGALLDPVPGSGGPVRYGGPPARGGAVEDPRKDPGSAPPPSQTPCLDPQGRGPPSGQGEGGPPKTPGTPDPWVPQEDRRISRTRTPFLHSLAQEGRALLPRDSVVAGGNAPPATETGRPGSLVARQPQAASVGNPSSEPRGPGSGLGAPGIGAGLGAPPSGANLMVPGSGLGFPGSGTGGPRPVRRGQRYATALRQQVQTKRAQLLKSRSAAPLTCEGQGGGQEEEEGGHEGQEGQGTTSACSSSYKDHLKEAQARVLQATSFQRRDLGPPGPDGRAPPLPAQVGRQRRPPRRVHSFSEPDKMDRVGRGEESRGGEGGGRRSAFARPLLKTGPRGSTADPRGEAGPGLDRGTSASRDVDTGVPVQPLRDRDQRLGTFAEYQATWTSARRPAGVPAKGRYRSAEDILDPQPDHAAATCVHERSRSSPSADLCLSTKGSGPWGDAGNPAGTTLHDAPQGSWPHGSLGAAAALQSSEPEAPPTPLDHAPSPAPSSPLPPRPPLEEPPPREEAGPCEGSPPTRTAPVRIVQSECSEREGRAYLPPPQQQTSTTSSSNPLPGPPTPPSLGPPPLPSPASSSSLFSVYTRPPPPPSPPTLVQPTPTQTGALVVCPRGGEGGGGGGDGGGDGEGGGGDGKGGGGGGGGGEGGDGGDGGEGEGGGGGDGGGGGEEEEAQRERLCQAIGVRDRALAEVLDRRGMRTTMDLMEGLFPQEGPPRDQRRRGPMGPRPAAEDPPGPLVPSSSYYSTSAPKAELLIRMKDILLEEEPEEQGEEPDQQDLVLKKRALILSLAQKLSVLREARLGLQEELQQNEALGREVEAGVQRLCPPHQLDKFRMFVGDLDKVVSLLLSLAGRLARTEIALGAAGEGAPDTGERRTLEEKRLLLLRQHADALELKANLDRRECVVSRVMEARLDPGALEDYRHHVRMKGALATERRLLDDRLKLGAEQLACLMDSLPPDQRPLLGALDPGPRWV
ncbi:protein Shroom2 isoform X1 [Gadus morhua]|uniref:protein Shroom2 isoform X1 n=1 Tax=Gadus morhua TaxID=8049 RepID=UPI0011B5EDFA|nr:protein Shroom2-like isoform X1 [Gadus morhua]XP_030218230.1 protein Shroom2-like isoform X1 [Gadus morhua]